jgi:hypothetical protein
MIRALVVIALAGCGRIGFHALGDAGVTTDGQSDAAQCTPEQCNGIDDDCDGLVDEGCPCTAFSTSVPASGGVAGAIVSTGTDYLLAEGTAIDVVGSAGTATAMSDPSALLANNIGSWAWNGGELVYVDPSGALGFYTPGGTTRLGPALGLQSPWLFPLVQRRAGGYDLAVAFRSVSYVRTDTLGKPLGSAATATFTNAMTCAFGQAGDTPIFAWYENDSTMGAQTVYQSPALGAALSGTVIIDQVCAPIAATDGNVTVVGDVLGDLYAIGSAGVSPITGVGPFVAFAWTGDGWDAVTENLANPATLTLVHLDPSFALTSMQTLFSEPYTHSAGASPVAISADARRTLVAVTLTIDSNPSLTYIAQTCH